MKAWLPISILILAGLGPASGLAQDAGAARATFAPPPALPGTFGLRELTVTTPPPPGAIQLPSGVYPQPGQVILRENMPGHRRFRPPLFPRSGWDSPSFDNGRKDYGRYLQDYWDAPYLPAAVDEAYPDMDEPGWTQPGPYLARVARSQASAEEEALMERRLAFIVDRVLQAAPFQDLRGSSLEPQLTIHGYGEERGLAARKIVRAEATLMLRRIQAHGGQMQRMPDRRVRSFRDGPYLRLVINPDSSWDCPEPAAARDGSVMCSDGQQRQFWTGSRAPHQATRTSDGHSIASMNRAFYQDDRPASDLRLLLVEKVGAGETEQELNRGRMHPHADVGRILGAIRTIDWNTLLRQANEIQ